MIAPRQNVEDKHQPRLLLRHLSKRNAQRMLEKYTQTNKQLQNKLLCLHCFLAIHNKTFWHISIDKNTLFAWLEVQSSPYSFEDVLGCQKLITIWWKITPDQNLEEYNFVSKVDDRCWMKLTLWSDLPGGSIGSHTSLKSGKTWYFSVAYSEKIFPCAFFHWPLFFCGVFREKTYLGGSLVGAILQANHALASF